MSFAVFTRRIWLSLDGARRAVSPCFQVFTLSYYCDQLKIYIDISIDVLCKLGTSISSNLHYRLYNHYHILITMLFIQAEYMCDFIPFSQYFVEYQSSKYSPQATKNLKCLCPYLAAAPSSERRARLGGSRARLVRTPQAEKHISVLLESSSITKNW